MRERNHRRSLPRRCPSTSTVWKIIYCICADMCSSMSLLKFFLYSKWHSTYSHLRNKNMRQVVAHERLKQWKFINRQSQKVVVVAYSVWSFSRGSNCKALTGKNLVFWISGCLREVVTHGGTILIKSEEPRSGDLMKILYCTVFSFTK